MSIGDILHPSGESPPFSSEQPLSLEENRPRDEWSFALLLPRMRSVLDELDKTDVRPPAAFAAAPAGARSATPLLDLLGNNVLQLQEAFTDSLYESLRQWGVDASAKLTLRLNDEARLCLEGDHPEKERITEMLAALPEYSEMFAEIAVQSAALRDLKNLWTMTMYDRARDSYAALAAMALNSHYQISVKGEMNHFYFTK